jgi:hypothetical protein
VVLAVFYTLTPNGEPKIAYKDVKDFSRAAGRALPEARDAILQIRWRKVDGDRPGRSLTG